MTRRGLVLGAGGVLGFAWTAGTLQALAEVEGWDPATADVLVGTSAGSVMAATLGCGGTVEQVLAHQQDEHVTVEVDDRELAIAYDNERDNPDSLPPRPSLRPGSPGLLLRRAVRVRRTPPMVLLAGLLPPGRATHGRLRATVEGLAGDGWARSDTRIVTMDYDTGARVAFGGPGAPPASLADAVVASCSIPGWFEPVRIGRHRYVDGGVCSTTSLDLLAHEGLDEIVVVAPMVSFAYDRPSSWMTRLERQTRRLATRRLLHEARAVRAAGTKVTLVGPGPEDLAVMGANLMDPRRRRKVLDTALRTGRVALSEHTDRTGALGA